jgi:adenylate kinase
MNIVLFGKPGAGKGTQAPKIADALGVPTLATGNVLRAAVREGTPMGKAAKAYMDRGDLVPDEVILGIIRDELAKSDYGKGVVLDGVVRTVPQAEGLSEVLRSLGRRVDAVVSLDVPDDEIIRRMGSRLVCVKCQTPFSAGKPGDACSNCGGTLARRSDDEPEAVRNRLNVFDEQTKPVFDWYTKSGTRMAVVNANGSVSDVTSRVMKALGR